MKVGKMVFKSALKSFKIIVEKHDNGFVAYPLGLVGAVLGEGDTAEEALADVKSAIKEYFEVFGEEMDLADNPPREVFVVEAEVAV